MFDVLPHFHFPVIFGHVWSSLVISATGTPPLPLLHSLRTMAEL
jgi:hypothetical protein